MSPLELAGPAGPVWIDMAKAPRTGREILLLLGETIPDHADVRVGSFVTGPEADEMGYREYAKYGAWMIWNSDYDWFCVDENEPLGWLPLPDKMPLLHKIIEGAPSCRAHLKGEE